MSALALSHRALSLAPHHFVARSTSPSMFALTTPTTCVAAVACLGSERPRGARVASLAGRHVGSTGGDRVAMRVGGARSARSVRTAATEDSETSLGGSDSSGSERTYAPAAFAGENFDKTAVFPRVKERDPYRRLGIDAEASYEEVQDARNYLVDTYRGHSAGVESIEAAFDRIIQDKLRTRKKAKGLRLKRKKENDPNYVPPFLERLKSRFEKPDDQTIVRRAVIYVIMAGWAIVQSASSGPAFQMAISFGLTVYFLHEKRGKNKDLLGKAFINAFVALVLGWLVGSIFPVYIPIFPPAWGPELILSLFSFVAFFVFATFLK